TLALHATFASRRPAARSPIPRRARGIRVTTACSEARMRVSEDNGRFRSYLRDAGGNPSRRGSHLRGVSRSGFRGSGVTTDLSRLGNRVAPPDAQRFGTGLALLEARRAMRQKRRGL